MSRRSVRDVVRVIWLPSNTDPPHSCKQRVKVSAVYPSVITSSLSNFDRDDIWWTDPESTSGVTFLSLHPSRLAQTGREDWPVHYCCRLLHTRCIPRRAENMRLSKLMAIVASCLMPSRPVSSDERSTFIEIVPRRSNMHMQVMRRATTSISDMQETSYMDHCHFIRKSTNRRWNVDHQSARAYPLLRCHQRAIDLLPSFIRPCNRLSC